MIKAVSLLSLVLVLTAFYVQRSIDKLQPEHFPEWSYDLKLNPLSEARIFLGRMLFYDPVLSKDHSISCASCHSPYNAFAHTDHTLSHGIGDSTGTRNAPPLFNLAWQSLFMWDGAINHLDMQALAPISHPREMGEDLKHVVEKLSNQPEYKRLFEEAYGESVITGERVLKALSQFQLTLVSDGSKYDDVIRGTSDFTAQESRGYDLFKNHCNTCHQEPLFSTYKFARNGLPIDSVLQDYGRQTVTLNSKDSLNFKIPSLRNLSYTYPYMHDGRFKTLHQVINHYVGSDFAEFSSKSKSVKAIRLLPTERVDLIAFLLTLNDEKFVFNSKHQFPKEILELSKE